MGLKNNIQAAGLFHACAIPDRFNQAGLCWQLDSKFGNGYYWIYAREEMFYIKIHDFYFHEDTVLTFDWPESMSITVYDSISGEELSPYRRLTAGYIKTFIGGSKEQYRLLIHKGIPIRSIGIEITPDYCKDYLQKQFPDSYYRLLPLFQSIDQTMDFPEMERLLHQVALWRGDGFSAALFYESKVMEAIRLIAEYQPKVGESNLSISKTDQQHLDSLAAYINDHYAYDLPQKQLTQIACMGSTKLKSLFHQMYGCTITEYIQHRRMAQAEHLLARTDLSIGQIAQTVGYSSPSRFSELFSRTVGITPSEYRKLSNL